MLQGVRFFAEHFLTYVYFIAELTHKKSPFYFKTAYISVSVTFNHFSLVRFSKHESDWRGYQENNRLHLRLPTLLPQLLLQQQHQRVEVTPHLLNIANTCFQSINDFFDCSTCVIHNNHPTLIITLKYLRGMYWSGW